MDSLTKLIALNKRVCIHVDDYNSFHKQHRPSDFRDIYSYIQLYFLYHYTPYFLKNKASQIDSFIDNGIRILMLSSEIYDSHLFVIDKNYEEMSDQKATLLNQQKNADLTEYDVIINTYDPDMHSDWESNDGICAKICSGDFKIRDDAIYIEFKSNMRYKKNSQNKFFNLHLRQSYGKMPKPIILTTSDNQKTRIQYGPWPIDYLDWRSFTPWKKETKNE